MNFFGCPPNEPALYLTIQRHETIDGTGDQEDEIIRPCMARDAQVFQCRNGKLDRTVSYMVYNEDVFNNFIVESTQFTKWDEMVMKAADEKFGK